MAERFFSRDISWLSFNYRVLLEAANENVPLANRFLFLSIFSSNLDEWYRVRMPVLAAKQQYAIDRPNSKYNLSSSISEFDDARQLINSYQEQFGHILTGQLIPLLEKQNIILLYRRVIPEELRKAVDDYFFTILASFLQSNFITPEANFFPENNRLYLLVVLIKHGEESSVIINIPSDFVSRFFSLNNDEKQYLIFIDDIIKEQLTFLFPGNEIIGCYSFKVNRNAELNLDEDLPENIADKIEKQIAKRDMGITSRLLYQSNLPLRHLQLLCDICKTSLSNAMEGGIYHNLKDLNDLPITNKNLFYPKQSSLSAVQVQRQTSLFSLIEKKDIIIHPPYNDYGTVLRFFNEAAIDDDVEEIYVTLYRIASDSKIANALISAAKNGKNVQVFVELKARFDEANNIRWSKKMKEAGVKVIYSIPELKVHAKVALIKRKDRKRNKGLALLATGNLNESTARFYTDHVLLTAEKNLATELEMLFHFLSKRKKPDESDAISFKHLLVAQFNLQTGFLKLLDNEIENAKKGLSASVTIKLNNLEEQVLISKLYEASEAGVEVHLIVRSICCCIPGVEGMSENINIKRIVGRYLEHGRVFIFHNNGDVKVFMGSADWMNRNIYTRIEVCFPVYDKTVKQQMIDIINLQWNDNVQAVWLDENINNVPIVRDDKETIVDSQKDIYEYLQKHHSY